jgi:hypothetical protein
MPVAQALSACTMIVDVDRCCISCITASAQRRACACGARLFAARNINTSLSGKLFFSMCWCIRDAVHLDSRVHAAKYSHLTILEGNMAKKAKKAKKAKSAVKKTAKKTKKVAKKKK